MHLSVNKTVVLFLLSACFIGARGQISVQPTDLEVITRQLSENSHKEDKRAWVYSEEKSVIKKINPAGLIYGSTLFVYQNVFSKHFSTDCLYSPGCSDFSKQIVRKEGLIKGILLSFDRINRCNRIVAAGMKNRNRDPKTGKFIDPVSIYIKQN